MAGVGSAPPDHPPLQDSPFHLIRRFFCYLLLLRTYTRWQSAAQTGSTSSDVSPTYSGPTANAFLAEFF